MHDYYYRDANEAGEVIIQASDTQLSVRVTEDDGQTSALIFLPMEEIDRMMAGLQAAKQKICVQSSKERRDNGI